MPLDARKQDHIRRMVARTHAGRDQLVVLTLRTADGGTTTITRRAVWRIQGDFDPTMPGPANVHAHIGSAQDVFAMFDAGDTTLDQLRACIYAELGDDAAGAQIAERFTLLDIEPVGALPGATRLFTRWSRQRSH